MKVGMAREEWIFWQTVMRSTWVSTIETDGGAFSLYEVGGGFAKQIGERASRARVPAGHIALSRNQAERSLFLWGGRLLPKSKADGPAADAECLEVYG